MSKNTHEYGAETRSNGDNVPKKEANKPPMGVRFTAENQPDPKKQSNTKQKRKIGREILRDMMAAKFEFKEDSPIRQELVKLYGKNVLRLSALEIMTIRIMQKCVKEGNVQAYRELMIQTFGQPKFTAELSGLDGAPLIGISQTTNVIFKNPNGSAE